MYIHVGMVWVKAVTTVEPRPLQRPPLGNEVLAIIEAGVAGLSYSV